MKGTIDKLIDDLVEEEETVLGSKTSFLTVQDISRRVWFKTPFESRHFDGNPAYWPNLLKPLEGKSISNHHLRKKKHTLLYQNQPTSSNNEAPAEAVINSTNSDIKRHEKTLWQVTAVNFSNDNRTVTVNALLDSRANSKIIDKEVTITFELQE